jgi:hypothetical protein
VILGIGGIAGHAHRYEPARNTGYLGRLRIVHNVSAVTAACLLVRREVYDEVGGLEEMLPIAFNDVDFCLKVLDRGYVNIWTPLPSSSTTNPSAAAAASLPTRAFSGRDAVDGEPLEPEIEGGSVLLPQLDAGT